MALAKSQKSLKNWTKQKWRTKSGKAQALKALKLLENATYQRKAIKSLSAKEYAAYHQKEKKRHKGW